MIEEALRTILLADPTLYALVGTRIYPVQLPLDCTLPALSYFQVSEQFNRITGTPRFQIDIFSNDYSQSFLYLLSILTTPKQEFITSPMTSR